MKNDVWEIVSRPEGKSVVTSKWIYKIKHATNGSIEKYKAMFVARGFSQKEEAEARGFSTQGQESGSGGLL
jgi:hypothetical protein